MSILLHMHTHKDDDYDLCESHGVPNMFSFRVKNSNSHFSTCLVLLHMHTHKDGDYDPCESHGVPNMFSFRVKNSNSHFTTCLVLLHMHTHKGDDPCESHGVPKNIEAHLCLHKHNICTFCSCTCIHCFR